MPPVVKQKKNIHRSMPYDRETGKLRVPKFLKLGRKFFKEMAEEPDYEGYEEDTLEVLPFGPDRDDPAPGRSGHDEPSAPTASQQNNVPALGEGEDKDPDADETFSGALQELDLTNLPREYYFGNEESDDEYRYPGSNEEDTGTPTPTPAITSAYNALPIGTNYSLAEHLHLFDWVEETMIRKERPLRLADFKELEVLRQQTFGLRTVKVGELLADGITKATFEWRYKQRSHNALHSYCTKMDMNGGDYQILLEKLPARIAQRKRLDAEKRGKL